MGLRIRADGLDRLFEEAGRALFWVIVEDFDQIRPIEQFTFQLQGERHDELLRDWLAELLYVFSAQRRLLAEFEVDVRPPGLMATARGEPIDAARHKIDTEIKAITYHGLRVEQDNGGWLAEVIVDV